MRTNSFYPLFLFFQHERTPYLQIISPDLSVTVSVTLQRRGVRGSVHWGCYYATALDIEVDPQRCGLGSCQSDFALQSVVECSALEPECFRVDVLR